MTPLEALERAVDVLGGQTALANICGGNVKQQHVWNWLNRDKRLPDRYAIRVSRACQAAGTDVPAERLCPEMFDDAVA